MQLTASEIRTSILDYVGNTPLVQYPIESAGKIYAKLEYLNPGGSIKIRSAINMIEAAEERGDLKPGGTIVEASSGNQGIALAMIGAIKGYRVVITVKEKVSREKQQTLKAYGAELVIGSGSDDQNDPENYHNKAVQLAKTIPGAYMTDQHYNFDNAEGYYKTLGPEIWEQTDGRVTHFLAGVGTGGTINGTGRFLKEQNPDIKIIGIDMANSWYSSRGNPKPYKIEGIGIDYDNEWALGGLVDEFIAVTDEQALASVRHLARNYGFLVGGSSGAVGHALTQLAPKLEQDDVLVTVFPDSGQAYLSKNYFD